MAVEVPASRMEHVLPLQYSHTYGNNELRFLSGSIVALLTLSCTVSEDQEVALGRQNADQINAQLPIVQDPQLSGYMQSLGESIAKTTSRSDLDWHFYVVNTMQVNAFALPGGFIYVNRGLIANTTRLDELTGTLGHEIGHVIQRHSVKQMEKAQKTNVGVAVLCTLTSICQSGLGQAAVQVGGTALFARHSRLDEIQADSEAVVNVVRAGYDPQGIPDLFQVLMKERRHQPTAVDGWFSSHPLEEARIDNAKRLIAEMSPAGGPRLISDTENFQAFRAALAALPVPPPPRRLTAPPTPPPTPPETRP